MIESRQRRLVKFTKYEKDTEIIVTPNSQIRSSRLEKQTKNSRSSLKGFEG